MKKITFLFFILFTLSMKAQDKIGIYYDANKVGYSRVIGKRVGNIAGAYFTLGLSPANSNKVIEGETAETRIKDKKPVFTIYFGDDIDTEYIFSDPSNMDNLILIQLHEKKKTRSLRTGKYGLVAGVKTGIDEKDVQPLKIEKIDKNSYRVSPRKELKVGEYAFYYSGNVPEGKNEFNGIFDFSIIKK